MLSEHGEASKDELAVSLTVLTLRAQELCVKVEVAVLISVRVLWT